MRGAKRQEASENLRNENEAGLNYLEHSRVVCIGACLLT